VLVKVRLTNTSSHDIPAPGTFLAQGLDTSFQYDCRDARGNPVRREFAIFGSAHGVAPLKPGESRDEAAPLSVTCDFSRPGRYEIQVSRNVSSDPAEGVVKSNKVTVMVSPPPFSIHISLPKAGVKAGSAVPLNIRLTNTSSHEIALGGVIQPMTIDPRYGYFCYDSKGMAVTKGPPGAGGIPIAMLEPGVSLDEVVPISSACDLSHPGVYRIGLIRSDPTDPNHAGISSNDVTVTVLP
jgi:hypothetical protein